ncbi:MAG: hypothetical protein HBSIN02_11490 [Bacteroidia bacterium]|nr:MAG: hypothetical protein HBSIN02_11490 [Bacteroidia bacterium]
MKQTLIVTIVSTALFGPSFSQQPILSPRDSTEILIKGKKISINYGRPSMRGRVIMGGLVPYNKVWRTGANEATALETEADLQFGDVVLPKGSYTLYTLPSAGEWKLIINKQTGQWGTVYNPELDFARLAMKKDSLKTPVEKFTMSFRRNGNDGAILVLEWERTMVSIAFKVLNNNSSRSREEF